MSPIARRFRGVLIAIVVLGLSASAVFAARALPQFAAAFSAGATASQQERSVADEDQNETPDADEDQDGATADEDSADSDDADDADADQEASDNHGALVSEAARMDTPEGFTNHGAFVSCVAQMKDAPADFDLSTVTPDTCAATEATEDGSTSTDADGPKKDKAAKVKHGHGKGNSKHQGS